MVAFRYAVSAGLAMLSLASQPLRAEAPNGDRPMISHMENAVTQPAKDVNLKQQEIPARLLEIEKAPYDLTGISGCRTISTEIVSLRPMLGPDVNEGYELSRTEKRERSVSRVAGGMLASFIPFRGVVREVTGANAAEQRYQQALAAGFARRSFLKGIAHNQGCKIEPSASIPAAAPES